MADIRATQSGAFEATSTWFGGVVPGSGDIAYSNTFTVTISDTRTVQAISNAVGTSITVGGTFSLLNGCNLTCTNANGVVQGATATGCITTPSLGVGSSASVAANSSGGGSSTSGNVVFSTAGTLNWTGNVVGSAAATNSSAILVSGTGTLAFTGNATGGNNASAFGIGVSGAATVTITGNVTGASTNATGYGVNISGAGSVTITGTVTGGTGASAAAGANNASTGTLTVNGTCQSSATAAAIAAGGVGQVTRLSGPFLLGASGNINPIQCQSWRWAPTLIPTYLEVAQSNGSTKRNLFSADNMPSGGYPVAANVRQSTVYGPSSEFTGTLSVPSASSVALGVATDNTTGTAILTAANVRAAIGMASANLDTQLAGLSSGSAPSAATVASAVWSAVARTVTGGTVDTLTNAPSVPSATTIATAVWAAADKTGYSLTSTERQAIATAVEQSILNESDGQQVLNAIVGAIGNTNVDQVALIAAIRSDLERTGGKIDTRLAASGYTAPTTPPTKEAIALQVRTELTPELARVANCSTVDTTATAIQDAVSG